MTRINIYNETEHETYLAGWFDPDTAESFGEADEWDGNNHIGVITRSQWIDETLYRTKGGRWVQRRNASRYHSGPDTYTFITDEQAKDWLLRSQENDEAVEKYFGKLEEESGPGRPEIGSPINVRLGDTLLEQVDAYAAEHNIKRAAAIRALLETALDND